MYKCAQKSKLFFNTIRPIYTINKIPNQSGHNNIYVVTSDNKNHQDNIKEIEQLQQSLYQNFGIFSVSAPIINSQKNNKLLIGDNQFEDVLEKAGEIILSNN